MGAGVDSDPEFYALVATRSRVLSGPQGALRNKALRLYDFYGELFSEGQRRGEIRTDQRPLHLAEMMEGIVTIIAGNWLVGWWKDRTEPLEERFMNAVNVFLEGCKPIKLAELRPARANHAMKTKPKTARRPVRGG